MSIDAIDTNQDLLTSCPDYIKEAGGDTSVSYSNPIAYLMKILPEIYSASQNLQNGVADLTGSMELVTQKLNDAKDAELSAANQKLQEDEAKLNELANSDVDGNSAEFQAASQQLTVDQANYNNINSAYSSILQAMSPITTTDTNIATSISKDLAQLIQTVNYPLQILQNFAQNLMRLAV